MVDERERGDHLKGKGREVIKKGGNKRRRVGEVGGGAL